METIVLDALVENNSIRIPRRFNNKRIKVVLIDPSGENKKKRGLARKLNLKIDETLDDVIPFSDIEDSNRFVKELREKQWR